jgi:hypothetical protein
MNMMNPKEIKTHATFERLFPINEDLLQIIEEDMRDNKFDLSQPVVLANWEGQDELVCIDGHTRLQAAIRAGIEAIPVWIREDFDTEEAALGHAIKLQSHRRNMTDAELMACIGALDQVRPRGGNGKSGQTSSVPQSCGKESGRSASAKETAQIVGCSPRKVEQVRTVLKHADQETLDAVKKNEKSVNKAYQETQKKRKEVQSEESKPASGPEDAQIQATVAEDEPEPEGETEHESAPAMDPDDNKNDLDESEPAEDEESEDEDGFISVKFPMALHKALNQYDWTVEEMVEVYLEYLEQSKYYGRAEDEGSREDRDDETDEESEVEAA